MFDTMYIGTGHFSKNSLDSSKIGGAIQYSNISSLSFIASAVEEKYSMVSFNDPEFPKNF